MLLSNDKSFMGVKGKSRLDNYIFMEKYTFAKQMIIDACIPIVTLGSIW